MNRKFEAPRRFVGGSGKIARLFLDRIRLAGEHRLVHETIARTQQAAIAGDDITGDEVHHVTGDQLVEGNLTANSIAEHLCLEFNGAAQRIDGRLGPALLHDIKRYAQKDDDNDNNEARDLAGPGGEPAGKEEDEDQRIGKPVENLPPQPPAPANHGVIRSVDGKAALGLLIAQPVGSCSNVVEQFAER